ncbi:peptidase C45 [Alcaligenaceae bacterium]|nr:peptidase C45 [Alcaligenaceae bacterium]
MSIAQSDANTFPLVEVSGSPYERGRQHGAAVPDRIRASVALYKGQLDRRGVTPQRLQQLAQAMEKTIADYDEAYLEELRGIAAGARLSLAEIITVNCRTEMMFGHGALAQAPQEPDDGCTGIIVLPEASANGKLLHAHNWDWRQECVGTGIVLLMRRSDGPDLLTFTEAGALARHGFNSAGVSLSGNFLGSDRDYQQPAEVPLVLVRRKMLESANICAAMKVLWGARRFCSNNLMLAQAEGEAVNLECAPDEIFWLTPVDGILVHANHWLCPAARAKLQDTGLAMTPDSIYRQRRVSAAMHGRSGGIDWDTIKEALADDFAKPDGVLRYPKPSSFDSISATVATTCMEPASGFMHIARMPYAPPRHFAKYQL